MRRGVQELHHSEMLYSTRQGSWNTTFLSGVIPVHHASFLCNGIVHTFLSITLLIFNGFSIRKRFWTAENQSFLTIPNIHACRYCRYRHKISNAFNAMDVDTVDTQWFKLHCVS